MPGKIFLIVFIGWITLGCVSKGNNNSDPKFQQYYVNGEVLYYKYCSNCHQKNGSGLKRLYPPLNQSDFLNNDIDEIACIIRHGIKSKIIVNGTEYNMEMKSNPLLTDIEVAEILTYIYNAWDKEKGLIDSNSIQFDRCKK